MPASEGFVDWIACTFSMPDPSLGNGIDTACEVLHKTPADWSDCKPNNGYKQAARLLEGAQVMTGRSDMGVHLIVPGSALPDLLGAQQTVPALLTGLVRAGARLTRLDLAIDAVDSSLDIMALKHAYDVGARETLARDAPLIMSGHGGLTLYVGSRTSDRFLRIYNKAAEVKQRGIPAEGNDWIRIELELKGYFANSAAARIIADRGVARAAAVYIQAFINFTFNPQWVEVMGTVHEAIPRSSRKLTNTRAWLLGVCAAALARQLIAEPDFQTEFERSVAAALANLDKTQPNG